MLEYWDILDKNGRKTGRTIIRGNKPLTNGEYHLVVHIWVVNDRGEFLIQRRSNDRPMMPGEWAAHGGSALSGEGSRHAAIRELNEELGIRPPRREMVHIRRMLRKYSLNDIWAVKCNCDIEDLRLQKEEVDCVKWVTQMELKGMIEYGLFHNYGRSYFETVFSIPQKLISRGK